MEALLSMKQVADRTGVSLSAIRNRRACALWIWACAVNTAPTAARPRWVWQVSQIEKEFSKLPRFAPALPMERGRRAGAVRQPAAAKLLVFPSLADRAAKAAANGERNRLRRERRAAE